VIAKVEQALAGRPDARIACLGLTYKPDVDDFRESPALQIARTLSERYPGARCAPIPSRRRCRTRGWGS